MFGAYAFSAAPFAGEPNFSTGPTKGYARARDAAANGARVTDAAAYASKASNA